ncbi:MAG: hypothetical protein LBC35_04955 [Coriobacteriales bacterium]|jgi:hypothetical protein|nr:hypothetical protein [Coriobacteriales bacterium]
MDTNNTKTTPPSRALTKDVVIQTLRVNGLSDKNGLVKKDNSRQGSTLIWAMVLSVVLSLILVLVFMIIGLSQRQTVASQVKTQAYYTAETINEKLVNWFVGTPQALPVDTTDPVYVRYHDAWAFLENLWMTQDESGPIVETYTEADLGGTMGSAKTRFEFLGSTQDTLQITTTATYGGATETLQSTMNLFRASTFTVLNTHFDYNQPAAAAVLTDVEELGKWATAARMQLNSDGGLYEWNSSSSDYSDYGGLWWSYYLTRYGSLYEGAYLDMMDVGYANYDDYAHDSGILPGLPHQYSYRYLLPSYGYFDDSPFKVFLDGSRHAFTSTNTDSSFPINPVNGYPTEVIADTAFSAAYPKGIVLSVDWYAMAPPSASPYYLTAPVTYYTVDDADEPTSLYTDVTVAPYLSQGDDGEAMYGAVTAPLTYAELNLYFNDSSAKKLGVTKGVWANSGSLYTKRNTEIGAELYDERASDTSFSELASADAIFNDFTMIFADPGAEPEQEKRHSYIQPDVKVYNSPIVVQSNHELTITEAYIDAEGLDKAIVVEPGGSLILDGCVIKDGNIYVANGASLTISANSPSKIYGNIFCAGELTLQGDLTTYSAHGVAANVEHDYVGEKSGIFIYNDIRTGVGSLTVANNAKVIPGAGNQSGRIHSFVPYPEFTSSQANELFDSSRDLITNVTQMWDSPESWGIKTGMPLVVRIGTPVE